MFVSSAKRQKFSFFEAFGKSLIKIKKSNGPDPCGTPHVIFSNSEFTPLTETN